MRSSCAITACLIVVLATGISLLNVSEGSVETGDLQRAEESAREALSIFQVALPPLHPIIAAAEKRISAALTALR